MSMYNLLDMTAICLTVYFLTNHNAETLINQTHFVLRSKLQTIHRAYSIILHYNPSIFLPLFPKPIIHLIFSKHS